MLRSTNQLSVLCARVRRGEPGADRLLRRELESPLRQIVRHALRTSDTRSVVSRRAHYEATRLRGQDHHLGLDHEALVECVAQNLCNETVRQVRAGGRPSAVPDTVGGSLDESLVEWSCVN
jgi:hypothetical protein